MAAIFNRIGQLGLGVALFGGVVNSALYNGMYRIRQLAPFVKPISLSMRVLQLTVAIGRSFSIDLLESNRPLLAKAHISLFHGSRDQLFSIFVRNQEMFLS